jgi:hypothetical protein
VENLQSIGQMEHPVPERSADQLILKKKLTSLIAAPRKKPIEKFSTLRMGFVKSVISALQVQRKNSLVSELIILVHFDSMSSRFVRPNWRQKIVQILDVELHLHRQKL